MAIMLKRSNHALPVGVDTATGERLALSLAWLATHLQVIGPTGTGKSRLLFHLFQLLSKDLTGTIVLLDPKGSLYRMCRDWAILHGLTKRLVLFDPGDPDLVIGYNSLRPNGLSWATHAKAAREGILASRAQSSLDETPQLARFLFLILAAVRLLELTLIEAVGLLRPGSPIRKAVLPRLKDKDVFVYESLTYFDGLTPRRQEELGASTLARLEAFVYDPTIRHILTQQKRSLDLAQVLTHHQILLVNLEQYRPLRPDDVRLLGRLLVNDVLAHVFERPPTERGPVYLILDEVQDFATRDLCVALEKGRELGLHCILAHQHCAQLMEEDKSGYLFESVMNNARTKIIFGGTAVKDLEQFLVKEVLLDQFNPWTVKDELTSLECEPVETTRVSHSRSHSVSKGRGLAMPTSVSEGKSQAQSHGTSTGMASGIEETWGTSHSRALTQSAVESRSQSMSRGRAHTTGRGSAETDTEGVSDTESENVSSTYTEAESQSTQDARSHTSGQGQGSSATNAQGVSESGGESAGTSFTWDPYAPVQFFPNSMATSDASIQGTGMSDAHAETMSESSFESDGESHAQGHSKTSSQSDTMGQGTAHTTSYAHASTYSQSEADTVSEEEGESVSHTTGSSEAQTEGESHSQGVSQTRSHQTSESITTGKSRSVSQGHTPSVSCEESWSASETVQPFHEIHKRRVVSSRTFLSQEEFLTLGLQKIKAQKTGHFLLKVPTHPAVFVRAPWIDPPRLPAHILEQARQRIYSTQPYYSRVEEIEAEERERIKRITQALPQASSPLSDNSEPVEPRTFRDKKPAQRPSPS